MEDANTMNFDMFISYDSRDSEQAMKFVRELTVLGVRVWIDSNLQPGSRVVRSLQNILKDVPIVAVLVGQAGIGEWQSLEIEAAVARHVRIGRPVIPVLLGEGSATELPPFLSVFAWVRLSDANAIERIVHQVRMTCGRETRSSGPLGLVSLVRRAKERLIISGHTFDKLVNRTDVLAALTDLLSSGIKLTIVQLNHLSHYARAHQPFHDLESGSAQEHQSTGAIAAFERIYKHLDRSAVANFEVLLTNYMPRFRTIIADETVSIYLYMYAADVPDTPDLILEPSADERQDSVRRRVIFSAMKTINAPEVVPFIRSGTINTYWAESHVANWSNWSPTRRLHHKITYDFYVTYAQRFHDRFGTLIEREVKAHLDLLSGNTLVIGCGSGKEVDYLARRNPQNKVIGIDFSHVAIAMAKAEYPDIAQSFLHGDFYDLRHMNIVEMDNVVSNAVFVHLQLRDDIDEVLRSILHALKPKGLFLLRALYKENEGIPVKEEIDHSSGHGREWGSTRWFVYYSREELAARCSKAGFEVLEEETSQIAQQIIGVSESEQESIQQRGFRHAQYDGVFWPILLLRKRGELPADQFVVGQSAAKEADLRAC